MEALYKTRELDFFVTKTREILYSWIGNHGYRKLASAGTAGCNIPHSP